MPLKALSEPQSYSDCSAGRFTAWPYNFGALDFLFGAGAPSEPAAQRGPAGKGLQRGKAHHKSPARLGVAAKTRADTSLAWLHGAVCAWFLSPPYLFPPLPPAGRRRCLKSRLSTISPLFFFPNKFSPRRDPQGPRRRCLLPVLKRSDAFGVQEAGKV